MPEYIDRTAAITSPLWATDLCPAAVLSRLPSADVAPVVHAKWENCDWVEPDYHGFGTTRTPNAGMKCTNCVHVFKRDLLWKDNYCPNCGAKMDLEESR